MPCGSRFSGPDCLKDLVDAVGDLSLSGGVECDTSVEHSRVVAIGCNYRDIVGVVIFSDHIDTFARWEFRYGLLYIPNTFNYRRRFDGCRRYAELTFDVARWQLPDLLSELGGAA